MIRNLVGDIYDFWSKLMGHKIYDTLQINDEPSKQLFCTCGGRIITAHGNNQFYWTVIESTCPAIDMFTRIFTSLKSDFPTARTVRR